MRELRIGAARLLGRAHRLERLDLVDARIGRDLREAVHQLDESNTGLAVVAGILIAAHLAIAARPGWLGRAR